MELQGPLELIGPLGLRRFHLAKVCDSHVGHQHNYDHTTIVVSGRLRVIYDDHASREFGPGDAVPIAAHVQHTIKALAPDTRYLCVFSHRDFDGVVVQTYVGNADAYGHDRVIEPAPAVRTSLSA